MSAPDDRLLEQARQQLLFHREMGVREIDLSRPAGAGATVPAAGEPVTEPDGVEDRLEALRTLELGDCRRCRLCEKRRNIVFGTGSARARLMFVGEGPGRDEDIQGLPFVGRAGQLLNQIIKAMGFQREEVYIANVVKCRPPDNRTPLPDEVATCTPFLFSQIDIIRPEVIVALGAPAAQALVGSTAGITKIRGTFREFRGILVMPTFHPAYLLRNPAAKRQVWDDMQQVMGRLAPG